MKILHINSYYIKGLFYRNLYDVQKEKCLDIDVYVPSNRKYSDDNNDMGEYTKCSFIFSDFDRLFFFRKHRKILKDIKKHYNVADYDVMHAHSLFSNGYIAYMLNKEYGIPYIVAVRNTDVNVFFKKMFHLRSLGIEIMKNADKVIFISEPYKQEVLNSYVKVILQDELKEKAVVIPNGINEYWFENIYRERKKCISEDSTLKIIAVGDVNHNKNQEMTAVGCERLIREGTKIEFNIVGPDKDPKICSKLIEYDFVKYHGKKDKHELLDLYRKNDIFVMPSYTETFGLVYAEAMSQGLPVIYTKGQGFDRQFGEGAVGYHVDPADSSDIAGKIMAIIQDYESISYRCTENVTHFKWQDIADRYTSIYNELIANAQEK